MTIITGPVVPERTSAAIIPHAPRSPAPPTEELPTEPLPPEPVPTAEQNEIPCFTAPAPIRRKKLSFFGTITAQFLIAAVTGGILWLGINYGGEELGDIFRSIIDFLLNG